MEPRYVIGIDLGTTNCSLACADSSAAADAFSLPPVTLAPVPQLVNPGELRDEPLLPSSLYLPGALDFPEGSLALPWNAEPGYLVGRLAQKRGVENAGRLISSAKSWLSQAGVDRTSAILPWSATEGVKKLSPVEASRRYLQHLRDAWDFKMPDAPFADQQVLVTVPASFDAVARELTLSAAEQAGYRNVILLEEPQSAFYAWIERHPDWRQRVHAGDLILVVDIGGGTTDFTLIAVTEREGELALDRVAVGEHILLGGDNMDLALARTIEAQLAEKGTKLDGLQLHALWHNCRVAKEKLLEPGSKAKDEPVTILGKGTGLVGGTIKVKLLRSDLEAVLRDGFFPVVSSNDLPQRQRRIGLQEIGLPYAADAAITKHMARFLRQQAASVEHGEVRRGPSGLAAPTHVLFNGGVLNAGLLRERVITVLNSWLKEESLPPIEALIESSMPAVPGIPNPVKALTVAPFGMEEGTESAIPDREFGLVVGEPAEFRFFGSATRKNDPIGALIEDMGQDLEELSPMEVNLPATEGVGQLVPVSLETVVTETGVLQLWCVARDGRRWKLEFNVRERVNA